MPARAKGPRLYLRGGRSDRVPTWVILDSDRGRHEESTGCGESDRAGAERALEAYLANKHVTASSRDAKDPAVIPVADVLALYARDVAPKHSQPKETASRIGFLLDYFGDMSLARVTGETCEAYAASCKTDAVARRRLEELRAAVNYHRKRGLCSKIIEVVLPPKRQARERWLTRDEVARLVLSAWRYREIQKGVPTERRSRQHVAKFILVALYTGTRAGAVCAAALQPTPRHGHVDLDRGVFYRRAPGARITKKRQPPVPLPLRLLSHLRRWKRLGQKFAVEFDGQPVKRVTKAFRASAVDAGLTREGVTPHTLRHTAATWMMQAGTDVWQVAGYLGMSVEMLIANYGHHHPDHLAGAKGAFERMKR